MIRPVIGVVLAIAITTAMDASGYTMFSALPLLPLGLALWWWQRLSRREIGLVWGRLSHYGLAVLYAVVVPGLTAAFAVVAGAVDASGTEWNETLLDISLGSLTGILAVLLTEEGFFRGWLWAALERAGQGETRVLVWSSLAFTLWHVSVVTLDTGFDLPAGEIPIYLINVTLIGAVFGMLRMISGSVVVAAVAHSVWNGVVYPLYGFGERVGDLGIEQTHIYGPEVGLMGIGWNLAFVVAVGSCIVRLRKRSVNKTFPLR